MDGIEDIHHVRKSRAIRLEDECAPCLAFGLEARDGTQWIFSMADADVYDLIRQLQRVLFDVDPPRSGVGSPGHSA